MNESRRLTYKHRNYLANFFIKKEFGEEFCNPWAKNQKIMKEYARRIRNLILDCMGLVEGEEFVKFFNRNPDMFDHLHPLVYVPDLIQNLHINEEGLIKIIQDKVALPSSKKVVIMDTRDILNKFLPSLDLRNGGNLPYLDCFSSGCDIVIPSSINRSNLYRELQNVVIEFCIKFLSSPPGLVKYFYRISWDPTRIDTRTFLMPQGIMTFKDLKKRYPVYYDQLKVKFWNEF